MEVSTLQHHIFGGLVGTTTLSTEDTSDTHGLLGIADSQVAVAQLVLLAIECLEGCALGHRLNDNLVTLHHVSIEAVQGLTQCHHHVVGDVDDIVDRTQTDYAELVLQPLGALLDLTTSNADTGIALAGLCVLDNNIDGETVVVNDKIADNGFVGSGLVAILLQPGIQVSSYTPVRKGIGTVGGDIHLDEPITLQMIVFCGGGTDNCIFREYNDASMVSTDANLVLGTNHTH